ncbi:MAG: hypothetical protein ACXVHV_10030 [Methanobacterium sp.]
MIGGTFARTKQICEQLMMYRRDCGNSNFSDRTSLEDCMKEEAPCKAWSSSQRYFPTISH